MSHDYLSKDPTASLRINGAFVCIEKVDSSGSKIQDGHPQIPLGILSVIVAALSQLGSTIIAVITPQSTLIVKAILSELSLTGLSNLIGLRRVR